jgi:hypothetical protein
MQLHLQWNSGDKCFHAINAKIINFDKYSSLRRAFFDVFFSCEVHCNIRQINASEKQHIYHTCKCDRPAVRGQMGFPGLHFNKSVQDTGENSPQI